MNEQGYYFRFVIDLYSEEYRKDVFQYKDDWEYLGGDDSDKNAQYYRRDNIIEAFFSQNNNIYYVLSNESLESVKRVVQGME